jgi:hypothetical protein
MKTALLIILALVPCAGFGQSPQPGPLTVIFDGQHGGCNIAQVSCVSQVNGKPVCAYGRVAYYPRPGQPYTLWTYPKTDPSGVAINFQKCVYTLPLAVPWFDLKFLTGAFF